jgi:uncharacterized membrane protein (DUF4010 family)
MIESIQPFIVSIVIGLLVGIERERSHSHSAQALGVRSFILIGSIGTLCAQVANQALSGALAALVVGVILAGYWRSTDGRKGRRDIGMTTELAAALVFGLGFLAKSESLLALMLGVVLLVVLLSRSQLHRFSQNQLRSEEIQAAVVILILSIVVAPFLPDRAIDPWNLINPRRFIVILVVLATIQFCGYLALRLLGPKLGMSVTGFFGGLVSSTAVFLNLPGMVKKNPALLSAAIGSGLMATAATLLELALLVSMVDPSLTMTVGTSILAMILVLAGTAVFVSQNGQTEINHEPLTNPLDIKAAIRLALAFFVALTLIGLLHRFASQQAIYAASFIGGLFELQSVSMATLNLHIQQKMSQSSAAASIGLAVVASMISKIAVLMFLDRSRWALVLSSYLILATMIGGGIGFFLID